MKRKRKIQFWVPLSLILLFSLRAGKAEVTGAVGTENLHKKGDQAEEVTLFDGKTFEGWEVVTADNAKYWSVIDGVITVSNGAEPMPVNTYLATKDVYENFEFTCKFRLSGDHDSGFVNSGIQYRSILEEVEDGVRKIVGYQADIGREYWGDIYDEHRRGLLIKGNTEELLSNFKENEWGSYKIVCKGDDHKIYINWHLLSEYSEQDPNISRSGVIALQLHSGGVAKAEFKEIVIKKL